MIISSWNVNSVRARIENIKEYLKKFSPDIVMMQEIKTPDETYPYEDIKSLKYDFSFDKKPNEEDLKFNNILIDKTSADLLKGSEVDYVSELIGESFKISNPQTKSSCGCGVSFSL